MGMELTNEFDEKELCPEGSYAARCIRIVDMGTQTHKIYGDSRKVNFSFENLDEEDEEGNPFILHRTFNAKLTPKADLTKAIQKWQKIKIEKGDTFDIDELLDQVCMITVEHQESDDGTVRARITDITSVPKSMGKLPKAKSDIWSLYLDKKGFDQDLFDELPDWMQEAIAETDEYEALVDAGVAGGKKKGKGKKKAKDEDEDEEDEKPKRGKARGKAREEEEEEEEDERPSRRRGKKVEEEEEEEEEKPKRRSRKAKDEEDEEEEEDERPAKRGKGKKAKDEDEEEEEEERPSRRRRR
jgi:hypothetical protein